MDAPRVEKVLFLLQQPFYPPTSGPQHLTWGQIGWMASRATCEVIGFYANPEELERWRMLETALPHVRIIKLVPRSRGWRRSAGRLRRFLTGRPVSFAVFDVPELHLWLGEHATELDCDLVHFDSFNLDMYRRHFAHRPTVLVPYDAFSMSARRGLDAARTFLSKLVYYWKWRVYLRHERQEYRCFTKVCPVSLVDLAWLRAGDPAIDAQVVGIPIAEEYLADPGPSGGAVNLHLLCCGYFAEDAISEGMVEFLAEVYPALKQGSVRFSISVWGARPSRRLVRALQAAPEVRHVGYVDDYVAFLKSATIYVLPQRYGAGIQTKVQQAMALGIPVVTRPAVLEALGAIDGEHGFGCQTNEQMTIRLRELLEDGLLRQRVGEVGRQLMRKSYGVEQIGRQLENAYCAAISKHRNAQVGQIVRAN